MGTMKSLALVALVVVGLGQTAQAAKMSWKWTSWEPGRGVVLTDLSAVSTASAQPALSQSAPAPPSNPAPVAMLQSSAYSPAGQEIDRGTTNSAVASPTYDGFVNLGAGPYPAAASLTTGNPQPWYTSPVVTQLFGGTPSAQQQADFTGAVLQRVEQTYQMSGLPVELTGDPSLPAHHTLSVVSNVSYGPSADAVGITYQGGDGLSFIDKFGAAKSVDELEWAVAHNVAHELMHAFGGGHHDTTGTYLDAAVSPWSALVDPGTIFSPEAVQDMLSQDFRRDPGLFYGADAQMLKPGHAGQCPCASCQLLASGTASVPEPTTWALWTLGLIATVARIRPRRTPA